MHSALLILIIFFITVIVIIRISLLFCNKLKLFLYDNDYKTRFKTFASGVNCSYLSTNPEKERQKVIIMAAEKFQNYTFLLILIQLNLGI
jgi:hypothetical protein